MRGPAVVTEREEGVCDRAPSRVQFAIFVRITPRDARAIKADEPRHANQRIFAGHRWFDRQQAIIGGTFGAAISPAKVGGQIAVTVDENNPAFGPSSIVRTATASGRHAHYCQFVLLNRFAPRQRQAAVQGIDLRYQPVVEHELVHRRDPDREPNSDDRDGDHQFDNGETEALLHAGKYWRGISTFHPECVRAVAPSPRTVGDGPCLAALA